MINIDCKKINQIIYQEYNSGIEYSDDVLLEFNLLDESPEMIIFRYGVGSSLKNREQIIYNEGNIIITKHYNNERINKEEKIFGNICIYRVLSSNEIGKEKEIWLNKYIKQYYANLIFDIDLERNTGVMVFYQLRLLDDTIFNNWGYLNYLANNLSNFNKELIEESNIKIISEEELEHEKI
jgi:hypothetical protein